MKSLDTVWVIYDPQRYATGRAYYELYVKHFADIGIKALLFSGLDTNFLELGYLPCAVIMRIYAPCLTKFFEGQGIRVYNNSQVADYGNNKHLAYSFAQQENITIPHTQLVKKGDTVDIDYPVVIKSIFGHGGKEVFWVRDRKDYEDAISRIAEEEFLIQRPVSDLGKDLRVYVVGNQIVACMLRHNPRDFRSNYSLGGSVTVYQLDKQEKAIVDTIISKLQIGMAGIDFIFDKGRLIFNEIEDIVGARMLYANTNIDIVKLFVDHIYKDISTDL